MIFSQRILLLLRTSAIVRLAGGDESWAVLILPEVFLTPLLGDTHA
jgi:hypothetical protein